MHDTLCKILTADKMCLPAHRCRSAAWQNAPTLKPSIIRASQTRLKLKALNIDDSKLIPSKNVLVCGS